MHQHDLSGAALLIIIYQSFAKRFSQLINVAGWVLLVLAVGWLLPDLPRLLSLNLSGLPMEDTMIMEYGNDNSRTAGSIVAGLAQRTQAS